MNEVINLSKSDEIRTPARAEMVDKICPKCTFGRMTQTGRVAQPDPKQPPIFEHLYSKCRHREAYDRQYPRVEFFKVEKDPAEKETTHD